jgi:hypothetical protein
MGIPLSKKYHCWPGCGVVRGTKGIASGMRGMIVLMTGISFRAFMGALGSISAMMSPTVEDCLIWVSKKSLSITFSIMITKHFPGLFRSPNVKILS